MNLTNQFAQVDLSLISDEEVSALDEPSKQALGVLADAVSTRKACSERMAAANRRLAAASVAEEAALQAHQTASDPFPFKPPEGMSPAQIAQLRELHDLRVREWRADEARRASIKSYSEVHNAQPS